MSIDLDKLMQQLPVMADHCLDLADAGPDDGWWTHRGPVLPVVARPQLSQELEELFEYAVQNRIVLAPIGDGTSRFIGQMDAGRTVLLVQPGYTSLWHGPNEEDRTAWFPAGVSVADAETLLNNAGFTMSPWPEDHGTLGGNWVHPRGSFGCREFRHAAARRTGAQALLGTGEWVRSNDTPRSAAGPNLLAAMSGCGPAIGLVTQVQLLIRPLGELAVMRGQTDDLAGLCQRLQALVRDDYLPTSCTVWKGEGKSWNVMWRQNVWHDWAERTLQQAAGTLALQELDQDTQLPELAGGDSIFVPWSKVAEAAKRKRGIHFCGPTPEGLVAIGQPAEPIPGHWGDWLEGASERGVLPTAGAL